MQILNDAYMYQNHIFNRDHLNYFFFRCENLSNSFHVLYRIYRDLKWKNILQFWFTKSVCELPRACLAEKKLSYILKVLSAVADAIN